MRRAIMAAAIALAVVGVLGSLPVVLHRTDKRVSVVTAADSCVHTMQSATLSDRANARAIVEADADRMSALAMRDGHWVHTYSQAFAPNLDTTHCVTGLNYSMDGGTHAVTFHVDLTIQQVVDVR